jgi:hypothetical protein
MLTTVPRPKAQSVSISIRFPVEMAERLAEMAQSRYRSVNGEVLAAVAEALAKWEFERAVPR